MGQNTYGELGIAASAPVPGVQQACVSTPTPVDLPAAVTGPGGVVGVSAGNEHTLLTTADGRVWAVGFNDSAQCGLGHVGKTPHWAPVAALSGRRQ